MFGDDQLSHAPGAEQGLPLLSMLMCVGTFPTESSGGRAMADQYKPGDTVPKDGRVRCTQYQGTQKNVKKGETFPPCDNWQQSHPKGCTWEYLS